MTTTGAFPDTPRIRGVRRRLERWRQTRPHQRAPIPEALWAAAVALAQQHGLYQTARALPINYGALKAHAARANHGEQAPLRPTFVELAPVPAGPVHECVIELDAPRGTSRVRVSGLAVADLVALVQVLGGREA